MKSITSEGKICKQRNEEAFEDLVVAEKNKGEIKVMHAMTSLFK